MIYILRHQEGSRSSNCLSRIGIRHCRDIYSRLRYKDVDVYTCYPDEHGKHVRPIQTASILCTYMNKSLQIIDLNHLPDDQYNHCVIIWHHKDIPTIIKHYTKQDFEWDERNYSGCIMIDDNQRLVYDPVYFSNHSLNCFFTVKYSWGDLFPNQQKMFSIKT